MQRAAMLGPLLKEGERENERGSNTFLAVRHIVTLMNEKEFADYQERMRVLAKQPYLRPGAVDMDMAYVNAINDAKDRVALWDLIEANPGKAVTLPSGLMGYVPHKRESGD